MRPSEKITKQLTVRGGWKVNPYGQTDRKISVFFYGFPKWIGEPLLLQHSPRFIAQCDVHITARHCTVLNVHCTLLQDST